MSLGLMDNVKEAKSEAKKRVNIVLHEEVWERTKILATVKGSGSASQLIEDLLMKILKSIKSMKLN